MSESVAGLFPFTKGRLRVEIGDHVIAEALALRKLCFRKGLQDDADPFDTGCLHLLLRDLPSQTVVCCFRLLILPANQISTSYAAQFYNLTGLQSYGAPVMELGRFALHPDWHHPDILRLGWAAMTRIVDALGVGLLFGCASFAGAQMAPHAAALRWLAARHLAPPSLRPLQKTRDAIPYAETLAPQRPDLAQAMAQMPPLLRTYLAMGGWVSDHAVLDPDLDTLHVFTAVEIAAIPAARARALREIAASGD